MKIRIATFLGLGAAAFAGGAQASPPVSAAALLDEAITELRDHHVNRAAVDWPGVTAAARAMLGDAQAPADAYPAIRHLIAALGEKHTLFLPASAPAPAQTSPAAATARPPRTPPDVRALPGRIGYMTLPGWPFSRESPTSEAWIAATREAMTRADAGGVCGWIVDVRNNGGGNVWPMLDIVAPLLGTPPFGAFVVTSREPILYENGRATYRGQLPAMPALPDLALRSAPAPVAVLMNGQTGSSGENVVMAFKGRDRTRFFGAATANYVSVNNPKKLADGSIITTTVGYTEDRTGFVHRTAITPDVAANEAEAIDVATAWLRESGCAAS